MSGGAVGSGKGVVTDGSGGKSGWAGLGLLKMSGNGGELGTVGTPGDI